MNVRLATLADTAAVVALFRARQRDAAQLDALSLVERWREGGPWLSVETCAVHLYRLLAGAAVPLLVESNGELLGEAEVYESFEPAPFGHRLHIGTLVTHRTRGGAAGQALLDYILQMARLMKCERVTATTHEIPMSEFFLEHGFRKARGLREVQFSAQPGRTLYQTADLTDYSPDQIKGWQMPLGNLQCSRQEWDRLLLAEWSSSLPELQNLAVSTLKLNVAGQQAIVHLLQGEIQGEAEVACWSARPLSGPLLAALRDRTFQDGYKTLSTYVLESDITGLGGDVVVGEILYNIYEHSV